MGNWVINIEGTGAHGNYEYDEDGTILGRSNIEDADLLFKEFIEKLSVLQNVTHASFTSGSTLTPENIISSGYVNEKHPYHILLNNALQYQKDLDSISVHTNPFRDHTFRITQLLLNKHGHELFPDRYFMESPTCSFKMFKGPDVIVAAKTRALNVKYSLEFAQDAQARVGITKAEIEIIDVLVKEIYTELLQEVNELKKDGAIMVPYTVVMPTRSVDVYTFQPVIGFKTRYGIMDKP